MLNNILTSLAALTTIYTIGKAVLSKSRPYQEGFMADCRAQKIFFLVANGPAEEVVYVVPTTFKVVCGVLVLYIHISYHGSSEA
jgi:hypothetical protein